MLKALLGFRNSTKADDGKKSRCLTRPHVEGDSRLEVARDFSETGVTPLLSLRGLSVQINLGKGSLSILDAVSFEIQPNKSLAIVGESGSGKTMTALAVTDLLPAAATRTGGEIWFQGIKLSTQGQSSFRALRGRKIACIFQNPHTALNPVFRIGTQFVDILRTHLALDNRQERGYAQELLHQVGLENSAAVLEAYPHQLSGGMAQRVCIAMALSCRPALLIADEPTSALDLASQAQILALLKKLQQRVGFALWLITHDIGIVAELADHVGVMKDGRMVEYGLADELLDHPQHPYTQFLLAANQIDLLPRSRQKADGSLHSKQFDDLGYEIARSRK